MLDHSPTDLYRFYGSDGQLLYVGISLSAAHRASQHRAEKPWWPDVARMDVEHFDNRVDAARAEMVAIKAEHPRYNIVGANQREVGEYVNVDRYSPVPFDATFMTCGEHETIVNAIQTVARRLDQADRDGASPPTRGDFVYAVNGVARSAVYGDCCDKCGEIRMPFKLEMEGPTRCKCTYVCAPCRLRWTCGWAIDISWMATL